MLLLVLVALIGLTAILVRKWGLTHPGSLLAAVWTLAIVVYLVVGRSIGLAPASWQASLLVAFGVGSFCATPLFAVKHGGRISAQIRKPQLMIATVVVSTLFVLGFVAFAKGISQAAGASLTELSLTQIRYYQTSEDRSGGGFFGLLYSLSPLALSLLFLSGRVISRLWYLGIVPVLVMTAQSPARTSSLTAVVAALLFVALTRSGDTRARVSRRAFALVGLFAAAIASLAYFVYSGVLLGKNRLDPALLIPGWLPEGLVSPSLYLTGGIPALSFAMESGLAQTEWGRSIYSLLRLGEAMGLGVVAPETIAEFVPVPIPFNVYTAFGDVWLDFGVISTGLIFVALGFVAHAAYVRAVGRGSLAYTWLVALAGTWALSSPISFRVFYLDSLFQAFFGALVLSAVQAPRKPGRAKDAEKAIQSAMVREMNR